MEDLFEELKALNDSKRFEEAGVLLHKIKESKAKTSQDLMSLAITYGHLGDFKKAVKYFEKAYAKRPSKLIYREMVELCIACKQGSLAAEYYNTFKDMGVADKVTLLEMKYEIQLLLNSPAKDKIATLKAIKTENYTELHAIELCKQLYKAGYKDECIKECQNLIMIFESGPYVERAKMIMAYLNGEITLEELTSGAVKQAVNTKAVEEAQVATETKDTEEVKAVEEPKIIEEPKVNEDAKITEKLEVPEYAQISEEPKTLETAKTVTETAFESTLADSITELITQSVDQSVETTENTKKEEPTETTAEAIYKKPVVINPIPLKENDIKLYETPLKFSNDLIPEGKAKKLIIDKKLDLTDCFKTYILIEDMRRQIIRAIEMCMSQKSTKYITIDGEESGGKSVLAGRMIECLYKTGLIASPLAAVLDSSDLSVEMLKNHKEDLRGKSIIIKNGGSLDIAVLSEIFKQSGKHGLATVILTDTSKNLGQLLRIDPKVNEIFNNRIHLVKYNVAERMSFVLDICREDGYELEEKAAEYIEKILSKNTKVESLGAICNYIKTVTDNADRRIAPSVLQMAKEAKYDEQCLVVTLDDLSMDLNNQTLN